MKFSVAENEAGRADKVLAKHYPEAGRKQLGELFDAGEVKLRGKKAKKGDMCAVGDELELAREPVSGEALRPLPDPSIMLEILVEEAAFEQRLRLPANPAEVQELGWILHGAVSHLAIRRHVYANTNPLPAERVIGLHIRSFLGGLAALLPAMPAG